MITVRFFQVGRDNDSDPQMKNLLEKIASIDVLSDREVRLGGQHDVRLERLEKDGDAYLVGEMTRIQSTNFPAEVHPDGTRPLNVSHPLGHGVAFRYNHIKSILGIQFDTRIISPPKFIDYLHAKGDKSSLRLTPIMRKDNWKRFGKGPAKKITIAIAGAESFSQLPLEGEPVATSIRRMGEAYGAPKIEITLNVGQGKARLRDGVKEAAKQFYEAMASGQIAVTKLKARVDASEGVDKIDLLDDLLSEKEELDLPENDPERRYKIKRDLIRRAMVSHGY